MGKPIIIYFYSEQNNKYYYLWDEINNNKNLGYTAISCDCTNMGNIFNLPFFTITKNKEIYEYTGELMLGNILMELGIDGFEDDFMTIII